MTVHFAYLTLALVLLWFPRNWLRLGLRVVSGKKRRAAPEQTPRDPNDRSVRPLEEAAKSRNWLDWLRAAVGAYGVTMVAFSASTPAPDAGAGGAETGVAEADLTRVLCQGLVLAAGMLVQTVRLEGRVSLFAPIFYAQGLAFGVAGPLVGSLAMLGSWALSPVLPGAGAILFVQGGITLSLGMLLQAEGRDPLLLMALTGVLWAPVLLSVLLRKRLSASFDKRVKLVEREPAERAATTAAGHPGGGGAGE